MVKILEELGCRATWDGNVLLVDSSTLNSTTVPEESVRKMRSSILYLGALLGRCHEVTIAYPGGCSIGKRPIDYHLNALKKMNVVEEFHGKEDTIIHCHTNCIMGNDIFRKAQCGCYTEYHLASTFPRCYKEYLMQQGNLK